MASLTTELFVRLLDGVTKPAAGVVRALRGIGSATDAVNARAPLGARLADASARASAQLDNVRGRMVDAAAAGYLLTRAIASPISAAIAFESTMADVAKVVDFPTPEAFNQMSADIIAMSKRIPIAANGIAEIVAAAGQAGIAGAELTEFTEGAAKVGVAFDISAGQAGDAMAKLRTGLALSNTEVFSLADAMNYLSNAQASSAEEILDVVTRVGAQAKMYGYSAEETAAFASAMISAGAESEVAATSFRNMGMALTRGASATTRQKEALADLGLNASETARRMQEDAVGTTIDVLERISQLPKEMQAAVASDLFGNEARALGPLLTNLDLVRDSMAMVADQTLYAGSAQKEFETRSKTTANAIILFKNNIGALGITIGNALIPALNQAMVAIVPIVDGITNWAAANPELTKNLILATGALIGFRVASIGVQYAAGFAKLGVIDFARSFVSVGSGVKGAAKLLASPFAAFGTHIAGVTQIAAMRFGMMNKEIRAGQLGLAGTVQGTFATMGRAAVGLINPLGLVGGAFKALKVALISTGVGAIVVGLAMAGVWIYENWNGLATMFASFGAAFTQAMGPVMPVIQPLIDGIGNLFNWVKGLLGPIDESGVAWTNWGTTAGTAVGNFVRGAIEGVQRFVTFVLGIPASLGSIAGDIAAIFTSIDWVAIGTNMITQLWEGIKAMFAQMGPWILAELQKMFTFNIQMPSWLGGPSEPAPGPAPAPGGGAPAAPAALPQMATGGPLRKGASAIVGDGGEPEVFTAGADGYVTPFSRLGEPITAASLDLGKQAPERPAGPVTFAPVFTIGDINGVDDFERRLADFARQMKEDFDQVMAGGFADTGTA